MHHLIALFGLQGCKNWPTPFPGRMSYKATKSGLVSVLYLSMCYTILLFIRAPFYVSLVFVAVCSVFWLFWLSYQYLPSDWLERLLWGSLIVARWSSPECPGGRVHMIFLVYCIASLCYYVFVLSPAPTWYIILLLNSKQENKQTLTQSHKVFFGRPLCLIPSASHVIQHLTQSLSSLRSTYPNYLDLLFLIIKLTGSNLKSSLSCSELLVCCREIALYMYTL